MAIKPLYNYLVELADGKLIQMTKNEYLKTLRDSQEIPKIKIIGQVIPINKTEITWNGLPGVKVVQKTIYCKYYTQDHISQLSNLVNTNISFLANKGHKNFIQNFNSLVINRLKKPFEITK